LPGFKDGFGNFVGDEFSVIRSWSPFAEVEGKSVPSFTARILELYAPEKFKLLKNRDKVELINYTGNLESYTSFSFDEMYEYLYSGQLSPKIHNKIILLGFFQKNAPMLLEDMHFTPLNSKITGKSFPDMYGVAIHANILSMMLNETYLKQLPMSASYAIATLLTFCFMLFIIRQYTKTEHPHHLKLLLLQTLIVILFIYLFLVIFTYLDVKILLLPIILSLVLTVEMFGVYKSLAKWLHKKIDYKTIFSKSIKAI
jgi:CHASE2 domain-containing sensor protein